MKQIGASCNLCSNGAQPKTEIVEMNREIEDPVATLVKIEKTIVEQHKEVINGYDKQVEEGLRDIATFSTKMIIMFEDYKKKGTAIELVKILNSIKNYAILTETNAMVLKTTIDSLLGKLQGAG
jgi:hypothetical protein